MSKKNKDDCKYNRLSRDFFKKERESITYEEAMKGVYPIEFSSEVLSGKRKITITEVKK